MMSIRAIIMALVLTVVGLVTVYIVLGVGSNVMGTFYTNTTNANYQAYQQSAQNVSNAAKLLAVLALVIVAGGIIGYLLYAFINQE